MYSLLPAHFVGNVFRSDKYLATCSRDVIRQHVSPHAERRSASPILIEIGMCYNILLKFPDTEFNEKSFSGSQVLEC
jgi:hypothetical protein